MAFGRSSSSDIPDGYREARDGEEPDMTLNGVDFVKTHNGLAAHNTDDGRFGKGNVANDHYEDTFDPDKRAKRSSAARDLSDAERGATKDGVKDAAGADSKDAITAQNAKESAVPADGASGFKSSVKGRDDAGKGKGKGRGFLKKGAPVAVVIASLLGFGGLSILGEMSLPVSLMNNLIGKYDSIGTSHNLRTLPFLKGQMNSSSRVISDGANDYVKKHSKIYSKFSGKDRAYFSLSKKQKKKLNNKGISVVEDDKGNSVMKYTQSDGKEITVTAAEFHDTYESNQEFRTAYYEGAKTWRSAVGDWFTKKTDELFHNNDASRNHFDDYDAGADDESRKKQLNDTVSKATSDDGVSGKTRDTSAETEEDEDGNTRTKAADDKDKGIATNSEDGNFDIPKDADSDTIKKKTESSIDSKMKAVAGKGVDIACSATEFIGGISLIVMAYQTAQIIKTASTIFDGIQRSQVEDSDTAPINEIANALTRSDNREYELVDLDNTPTGNGSSWSDDLKIATKKETSNKSAMEAESVGALYGGFIANPNNSGLQTFNISKNVTGIFKALGLKMTTYKACTYAQFALAAADLAGDIYEIAQCFLPPVVGCVGSLVHKGVKEAGKVALQVAAGVLKSLITSALVPFIANIITRHLATEVFGEDLGNTLVDGGNILMGSNHRYEGGAFADKDGYIAYLNQQDIVIADNARYARENLSPFDATSQYTFVGSLMTNTMPLLTQMGSLTQSVFSIRTVLGNSVKSLIPGVSAASNAITAEELQKFTEENCPDLADVGALGTEFCKPLMITDTSTINEDPGEVVYKVSNLRDNFEDSEGDIPTIKEGSPLAKHIAYCYISDTDPGIPDYNIANEVQTASTGSALVDGVIGAVPIAGSAVDIFNSTATIRNFGYINKEACVTNNSIGEGIDALSATPKWEDAKYYQRFAEDDLLAYSMGLTEESAVTNYITQFREKHPLDNSFEGTIARYSGLPKETVSYYLDMIDVLAFINDYDPTNLAPTINNNEEPIEKITFKDNKRRSKVLIGYTQNNNHLISNKRQAAITI